jgi:hypothetical protein
MSEIQRLCQQEYVDRFAPLPTEHHGAAPAT